MSKCFERTRNFEVQNIQTFSQNFLTCLFIACLSLNNKSSIFAWKFLESFGSWPSQPGPWLVNTIVQNLWKICQLSRNVTCQSKACKQLKGNDAEATQKSKSLQNQSRFVKKCQKSLYINVWGQPTGSPMATQWQPNGSPMAAHWQPTGSPLAAHWRPTGNKKIT